MPTPQPYISSKEAIAPLGCGSLRVSLLELELTRVDGAIEDDFKTWAQVYFVGGDGLPSHGLWPLNGEDAKLGRTSVSVWEDGSTRFGGGFGSRV